MIIDAPAASAQQSHSWIVSDISGEALERGADGTWHTLANGAILTPGAPVRTGAQGRMIVTHGQDRVTVSPESEFEIPSNSDPATGPNLLQRLGTLLFSIEHTPQRRFEVKTPYLAAVVKGTVFTVNAGSASERVHVAQGAVEVAAAVSHDVVLVRPGETAVVASAGRELSVLGRTGQSPNGQHQLERRSDRRSDSTETVTAHAAGDTPRLTRTIGETHPDIAALSNGLVAEAAPVGRGAAVRGTGGAAGDGSALGLESAASANGSADPPNPNGGSGVANPGSNANGNGNANGNAYANAYGNGNGNGNGNAYGSGNGPGGAANSHGGGPAGIAGTIGGVAALAPGNAVGGIAGAVNGNPAAAANAALKAAENGVGKPKGKP